MRPCLLIASIGKQEMVDDKGKTRTRVPKSLNVTLGGGSVQAGISMREKMAFSSSTMGFTKSRIRNYQGKLDTPTALGDLPHWLVACASVKAVLGMGGVWSTVRLLP